MPKTNDVEQGFNFIPTQTLNEENIISNNVNCTFHKIILSLIALILSTVFVISYLQINVNKNSSIETTINNNHHWFVIMIYV